MSQLASLVVQLVGALAVLTVGAELLVRGASMLARRLGISELAVGLTVVAFGTSAPELVVSLSAALGGSSDIAVGNVVGSNICNIALILGLSAVIHPMIVHTKIFKLDAPLLLVLSGALAAALHFGQLSRTVGIGLIVGLIAFTMTTLWLARRETDRASPDEVPATSGGSAVLDLLLIAAGLAGLVGGGNWFVGSAIDLARYFELSESLIGLTIVAVGTSLPELATSIVAALRGRGDLAVGNIVGSNIFNILGILGVTAVVQPLSAGGVGTLDLAYMLGLSLVLLPIVRSGFVVSRGEGALLLLSYVGYLAWRLIPT
ncbi:MAG: calcium/sodium antiporter [Planctomycetes bacterium]|nr:calcium/sodium antiporter [Planctomycetota bacterium]